MVPFKISVNHDEQVIELTINKVNGIFEIIYTGKIIAALRAPDFDWQLLPLDEMITDIPLYENDLNNFLNKNMVIDTPLLNQIIGAIENHIGTRI